MATDLNLKHLAVTFPAAVRVATVREKILEKCKNFQVREKSGNFIFSQGNLEKMKKSHGKVREFQNFPKKLIGFWKFYFLYIASNIRKVMLLNIPFVIFMV